MRWFAAVCIVVLGVFAFVRATTKRYAPGPLDLRLVDRSGIISRDLYTLTLDDGEPLLVATSARIMLTPGEHRVVVSPWVEFAAAAHKPTVITLTVTDGAPTPNRTLDVPVGPGFFQRLFAERLAPPGSARTPVHVAATLPGGTPAAGAWYTCGDAVMRLDALGEGECPATSTFGAVHVGIGALGSSFPLLVKTVSMELEPSVNFKPRLRTADNRDVRAPGLHLTINSKSQAIDQWYSTWNVVMPGLAQERAIACITFDELSACDVIPADGGLYEPDMLLGASAEVSFTPRLDGAPLNAPIIYLDRVRSDAVGSPVKLWVQPGRHVLILNAEGSAARHERIFEIAPGQQLDLGDLLMEVESSPP